jgi:hypothetical protein
MHYSFYNHIIPQKPSEYKTIAAKNLLQNRIYKKKLEEIRSISKIDGVPNDISSIKKYLDKRIKANKTE